MTASYSESASVRSGRMAHTQCLANVPHLIPQNPALPRSHPAPHLNLWKLTLNLRARERKNVRDADARITQQAIKGTPSAISAPRIKFEPRSPATPHTNQQSKIQNQKMRKVRKSPQKSALPLNLESTPFEPRPAP
jgi:hypothetical protein